MAENADTKQTRNRYSQVYDGRPDTGCLNGQAEELTALGSDL